MQRIIPQIDYEQLDVIAPAEPPVDLMSLQTEILGEWRLRHTHVHPYRELLYVAEGPVEYGINGNLLSCGRGAVVFFESDVPHDNGYPSGSSGLKHLWARIQGGRIAARVVTVDADGQISNDGNPVVLLEKKLGIDIDRIWPPGNQMVRPSHPQLTALAMLILNAVDEAMHSETKEDTPNLQAQVIETVKDHIHDTVARGESLQSLADWAGYSKFHFLRLFQSHTGVTVHQYIDDCRMARVQEMQENGCTQKEIANALGFSAPSSLSRWLRNQSWQ